MDKMDIFSTLSALQNHDSLSDSSSLLQDHESALSEKALPHVICGLLQVLPLTQLQVGQFVAVPLHIRLLPSSKLIIAPYTIWHNFYLSIG